MLPTLTNGTLKSRYPSYHSHSHQGVSFFNDFGTSEAWVMHITLVSHYCAHNQLDCWFVIHPQQTPIGYSWGFIYFRYTSMALGKPPRLATSQTSEVYDVVTPSLAGKRPILNKRTGEN